jgi:hypothetical protein
MERVYARRRRLPTSGERIRGSDVDKGGERTKGQAMVAYIALGIVMLAWVLTWESAQRTP